MNVPRFSFHSRHSTPALWLCLLSLACCLSAANAARASREAGLRLLQAQLPVGGSLRRLDCDHLAKAVKAATLAHRKDAVSILSAALTLDEWNARRKVEERLSCVCVSQLFQAAVSAAPDVAATLLQTSEALYPDCANALTTALQGMVVSNQLAVVSRATGPGNASPDGDPTGTATSDAGNASPDGNPSGTGTVTGNLNMTSPEGSSSGMGTTDPGASSSDGTSSSTGPGGSLDGSGNFGLGLGTGFPGAPGFAGGTGGGGGFTLPAPVSITTTAVVNR